MVARRKGISILLGLSVSVAVAAVGYYHFESQARMKLSEAQAMNAGINLTGRRAVVTGATAGICKGIAVRLAAAGASVTIVGRNPVRGAAVVEAMKEAAAAGAAARPAAAAIKETPAADTAASDHGSGSAAGAGGAGAGAGAAGGAAAAGAQTFEFVPVDAQHIANVRAFAAADAAKHGGRLDILVMGHGIATMQGRTLTKEGFDQKLALHYYSRVALAQAMLPQLRRSDDARVLSVFSAGVHSGYAKYKTDPELVDSYSLTNAANAGGMYNDIAWDSLSRDESNAGITFAHVCPGFVATNWGTEMPWLVRKFVRAMQAMAATSIEDCAEMLSVPLLQPKYKHHGFLMMTHKAEAAKVTSIHEEAREAVWAHTLEMLSRVPDPEAAVAAGTAADES